MAKNKLDDLSAGGVFHQKKINDIHRALFGDVVGRESNHAPAPDQNLGTESFQWDDIRAKTIYIAGIPVSAQLFTGSQTELISGKTSDFSTKAQFLFPIEGETSALIRGRGADLIYKVANIFNRVGTDLTIISLTTAPASNNTALVNLSYAADGFETRVIGEPWHTGIIFIEIDNIGTEISSRAGTWQSFKIGNEIFLAYINASSLGPCYRGWYYDEDGNPSPREVFSNNDSITLLSTAWIFLDIDGTTTDATYNAPKYTDDAPSSPATGDYWWDAINETWKRYNGASFVAVDRIYIGQVALDSDGAVGARSADFFSVSPKDAVIELVQDAASPTTKVALRRPRQNAFLFGVPLSFHHTLDKWDTATDFADATRTHSTSLVAAQTYYCYLDEQGSRIISDYEPYFISSLRAWMHPHENWRCFGGFRTSQTAAEVSQDVFTLAANQFNNEAHSIFTQIEARALTTNDDLPADLTAAHANSGCLVITNSTGLIGEIRPIEAGFYKITWRANLSNAIVFPGSNIHPKLVHSLFGFSVTRDQFINDDGEAAYVWYRPLVPSSGYYFLQIGFADEVGDDTIWGAGEITVQKISNVLS